MKFRVNADVYFAMTVEEVIDADSEEAAEEHKDEDGDDIIADYDDDEDPLEKMIQNYQTLGKKGMYSAGIIGKN